MIDRNSSITLSQRLGRVGTLTLIFSLYVAATALSMRYDFRHETEKDRLAFAAMCIAVVYVLVYRRFRGRDIWVFTVFALYFGIILIGAVYNLVELITVY